MSRIERLLRELSPVGVLFRELGDVIVDLRTGLNPRANFKLNPVGATNLYVTVRELGGFDIRPSDKTDRVDDAGLEIIQRRSRLKEGDVLFSATGTIGRTALVGRGPRDWNIKEGVYAISPDPRILESRFLIYLLHSKAIRGRILAQADGSTVASIPMATLRKIKIPVPSLDAQREIVRILGQFTQLQVELEAELEARRRQYEYYRGALLQFDPTETASVELSEAFEIRNGYTPAKSDPSNWVNGTVPWIRMEDIRENGRVLDRALQKIPEKAVKGGRCFPAGSLIFATSATIGEHALVTVPFLSNQRFTAIWPKRSYADRFDMKFLFYFGFVIDEWCRNNTTTSSFASVDMNGFRRLRIPMPPLHVQQRIAEQLDHFDALVNDTSIGLPAELAARRKQYEYYRDKLLTFEEAAA